ncbi:hypothetical protein L248_2103 [Schleiferilactobacillus shenzhenensis LY-73]|uniref:Uncharacterized protein n=1 Tax=Schleiferilactobacillus shenzhenensis LY-73 TaxID=1231336 RepID=U4TI86_9LACO|nr:hypothetical protein L248_2103 [Schleiferilactobacillus shenzhenensis LY-73]
MWDKAFDQGFVTFDAGDRTIRLAERIKDDDPQLYAALGPFKGKKLHEPATAAPKSNFLAYHNHEIFLDGH